MSLHLPELQSRKLLVAMSGESAGYNCAMQDVASARLSAMCPASCFRETVYSKFIDPEFIPVQ